MAGFLLHVLGAAAIASLVVTGVMAYEGSLQLAGHSKQQRNKSRDRSNSDPPEM
ncbi:hypothetical protein [Microvirga guangxiensis]|uniref:Uncharacterized protein n=1 Tax=Microvirga guangxiensis TaxID=549386 RepID=A0A1G5LHN2_9HYPH|nr:hypothetical protein [Microvirga guangxiensis]SCZ11669.1 hypothetical protein SAMN02927923_04272 [Microvirga guangxiensis]